MKKIFILYSFSLILILSLLFMCTPQINGPGDDNSSSSAVSSSISSIEDIVYLKTVTIAPATITAPGTVTVKFDINLPESVTIDNLIAFLSSPNQYLNNDGQYFLVNLSYKGSSGLWEGECFFDNYKQSGFWIIDEIECSTSDGGGFDYSYSGENPDYYFNNDLLEVSEIPVAKVNVATSNPDTVKPAVTAISANPTSIDSTGNVVITAYATDLLSGVSSILVGLWNNTAGTGINLYLDYNSSGGNWVKTIDFAPFETGDWYIQLFSVTDLAGNTNTYYYFDYISTGYYCNYDFPSLTVTTIPLVTITKTGSVSSVVKNLLTDKRSNILPDRNLPIRQNIKKSRKK